MESKIARELDRGVYVREGARNAPCPAYRNTKRGWVNYLIGGAVTFSHRQNDYEHYHYPYNLEMHDYYELIIYLSDDALQYIADGQYFTVPKGAALLIKPHTMHMLRLPDTNRCQRYVINFRAPEHLFPDPMALDFLSQGEQNYALFTTEKGNFAAICANLEATLANTCSPFQQARALWYLTELFITLSETRTAQTVQLHASQEIAPVPPFLLEVKSYIDANYLAIPSVSALAAHFHYNAEYLTRSFRRYFNTPLWEYVIRRRLMYCSTLLRKGERVGEAAMKSGFSNRASFTKLFRRHFGCTPSEYVLF